MYYTILTRRLSRWSDAQGRLVDKAVIQRVQNFEKPSIKFQTDVDLCEFVGGETRLPVPTGSENSAVLCATFNFK